MSSSNLGVIADRQPYTPPVDGDSAYVVFPKDRRVVVDDGTTIAYTVWPPVPDEPAEPSPRAATTAPAEPVPFLFANGWGCPDSYWAHIVPGLEARGHPCVLPDTRGHGASGLPVEPGRGARHLRPEDLSIPRFAQDLLAVLDDAGIEQAIVTGHSMGVQTALELYRLAPERVRALVLVAGPYENPLRTAYGISLFDHVFPFSRFVVRNLPELLAPLRTLVGNAHLGRFAARTMGAVGPKATPQHLRPYLLHVQASDPGVILATAEAMRRHSAADVLAGIAVPTLVVAAGHDTFTPARISHRMHGLIPGSELVLFPDAGHTLPIEEPEAIVAAIESFLARRVSDAA